LPPTNTAYLQAMPPVGSDPVPLYRPEAVLHAVLPAASRTLGQALLGTFHLRMGAQPLLYEQDDHLQGGWGRLFGQRARLAWDGSVSPSFDGELAGLQVGDDVLTRVTSQGDRDRVGLFISAGKMQGDVNGFALG
jgi:outer membrane autotransporter protein